MQGNKSTLQRSMNQPNTETQKIKINIRTLRKYQREQYRVDEQQTQARHELNPKRP